MDGHYDFEMSTSEKLSDFSPAMHLAITVLSGRKKWRGHVRGIGGVAKRNFEIVSIGTVENGILHFGETLSFDDGEVQNREWSLFETKAGVAVKGEGISLISPGRIVDGNFVITYRLKFGVLTFDYEDCFRILADGRADNTGCASIFGVKLMTITAKTEI